MIEKNSKINTLSFLEFGRKENFRQETSLAVFLKKCISQVVFLRFKTFNSSRKFFALNKGASMLILKKNEL